MNNVLLLEDHPAFLSHFHDVFGEFDHCETVGELASSRGSGWDYAFIDFALDDKYTGLGALMYLQEYSPETKAIVFTAIGENSRTLFALAARQWFGAWALLDKGLANDEKLSQVRDGVNPTPAAWTSRLQQNGWMINMLFQKPSWLKIWQLWGQFDGSATAITRANPELRANAVREFADEVPNVVAAFQQKFFPAELASTEAAIEASGRKAYAKRAVPLSAFAQRHSLFFQAPELADVLDHATPWTRRYDR